MSHMLVAIATPTASPAMFALVADLARRLGTRVTLLHVMTPGGGNPEAALNQTRETVEHLAGRLRQADVHCTMADAQTHEDIPGAVLTAAEGVGATLIVMAMTGKSAFVRRTGGDIPSQLLSRTTLPVLLLPPAAADTIL